MIILLKYLTLLCLAGILDMVIVGVCGSVHIVSHKEPTGWSITSQRARVLPERTRGCECWRTIGAYITQSSSDIDGDKE